MLTIVREDRTIQSVSRFEELVSDQRGPTVVQFQLLGSLRQNYDATNQFISRYQTFEFNKLNPEIEIRIYDGEYEKET